MRRLAPSSTPPPSSSPLLICPRCIRRSQLSPTFRRQSAFLASKRSLQPATDVTTKRNLSQLATPVIGLSSGPNWNALMHSNPPTETVTPAFPGIAHDVLDKMFERSPLWSTPRIFTPQINTEDPEGIQKYLLQGSPMPKTTVDLLTVLDALIAQDDLTRAAMIVSSLRRQLDPSTPLSTLVYNKYLEGLISSTISKSAGVGRAMDWYQEMEKSGVKADRTTFALLAKAAFSLAAVGDGNRAARKIFGIWRGQGGEVGDLLCDLMFPQEEIHRSLKLNKMELEDIGEGYRTVLEIVMRTVRQTQIILPENQPSRIATIPAAKSPNLAFMRQSLECLYAESNPATMERLSKAINSAEEADVFTSNYDMAQQRALEEGAYTSALEVWKHEMNEAQKRGDIFAGRLGIKTLAWDWVQAMKPVVEAHIERLRPKHIHPSGKELHMDVKKDTDNNHLDYIWLTALPVETFCAITIMETIRYQINDLKNNGCKATSLIVKIGKSIEKEFQAMDLVRKENKGLHPKHINLRQLMGKKHKLERYAARFHKDLVTGSKNGTTVWPYEWNFDVRTRCTAVLVSSFLDSAMIEMVIPSKTGDRTHTQVAPAFYYTYAYVNGKKLGIIKPNKYLAERFASQPILGKGVSIKLAPMLVPPKQWTNWDEGGYWYTREEVMRTRQSIEQKAYLKEASETNALGEVFHGLDVLGETAWTINRRIFDCIITIWNSGEAIADIPPQVSNLEYPVEPNAAKWDVKVRMEWVQQCKNMSRMMQNAHSQRCDINYKLEIARAFLGKKMFFPHSLDFRGRAYPVPPHFNHLGNDLCRGLLLFYSGKPLGQRGLRWLKIHLANVYGLDKMKLDEREEFASNSIENIFDSADHPLDGKRWWLNAESPWQCLATCFELTAALRSEDPTAYVCRLPIHQDGSCNGLQHYAALGGDIEGAKQVNLEPSDRPQDVYSAVAQLVAADIERQALEGNEIAVALKGKISRKIVKQTVMTNVYGVTFIGGKAQIYRALKDKGDVDTAILGLASDLITRSTFSVLKNMFKGAHEIQEWLKECARRISKSLGPKDFLEKSPSSLFPYLSTVVWTTPLGLPVCQPYRRADTKQIRTVLSDFQLTNPNSIGPTNGRKQATAFPPNYIHSLDASHMLRSAIACSRAGLTFASVHDSFWTHACDVDIMNVVLREAFVRMHQGDLIQKLKEEFLERYKGYYYLADESKTTDCASADISLDLNGIDIKGRTFKEVVTAVSKKSGKNWKPLTFPPIPKKGDFDVNRLKESMYFFS